jgi:xylulokinase
LLAAVGAGAWPDVHSACKEAVKITGSVKPDPGQVEAYRKMYELYRELYPVLKPSFEKMAS